ncbi:MAG: NAD(P)H-hydrate dehydratase [Anaerolineales bacterium]|nr:MAG: NAD(P)H-hydrate dehydratase [Anaerolineales bacterium]
MKLLSVDEMRRVEKASDKAGHSYAQMMQRAGQSVADAICARRDVKGRRVLVLVGPGNNGGDGLVAARALAAAGARVVSYLLKPRDGEKDDVLRSVQEAGLPVVTAEEDGKRQKLERLVLEADIVVDAVLGTGTRLPVRGAVSKALALVRDSLDERRRTRYQPLTAPAGIPATSVSSLFPYVAAVDGPSGLDFDTGALSKSAVPADLTVTFANPKLGHFIFPGASAAGELVVADIGIDPGLMPDSTPEVADADLVRELLPKRPADAHKGTFGKALIVAGSVNYTGAAYLAAAGAARSGVGLVTLALPGSIHATVASRLAEATYLLLPHESGVISEEAASVISGQMNEYDALLVGPGLGKEQETRAFLEALLGGEGRKGRMGFVSDKAGERAASTLPALVIDADGLNILAELDDWKERLPADTVLSPHPGEMARLMGKKVSDVQNDRVGTAQSTAAEWGAVVVLKGAYTVVAAPDGRAAIQPFANAGLATAGTGDVLAGAIVAMRAQGLEAFAAAVA